MISRYIVLLFTPLLIFSQNIYRPGNILTDERSQQSGRGYNKKQYEKNLEIAEQNLKKARDDKERATAYFQMGDAEYKMMKYFDAIKHFKEAGYYAEKSDFVSLEFSVNAYLSTAYHVIGITDQAEDLWKAAQKISNKTGNPENIYILYGIKALNLEREKKFCEAIQYDTLIYEYNKKEYQRTKKKSIRNDYLASSNFLTYLQLKCGNMHASKKLIEEFEAIYDPKSDYSNDYFLEFYYLDKALISIGENKSKEAHDWFEKAIERAKAQNNRGSLKIIIGERLLHDIGGDSSEQNYFKEYLELYNQAIKESSLAYNEEIRKQKESTEQQKINTKMLIVLSLILGILIILIVYYNARRKKELKSRFEAIINNLEQQNSGFMQSTSQEKASTWNKEEPAKQKIISDNKEAELIQKLEEFESGTVFTTKNFTLSDLASILDTNTKYTNYILKAHRGRNFNDYINKLRIDFIVQEIYHNPKYLNYKVSSLSDLAGFSSHSWFTSIFKKELNISPSDFIKNLNEANRKKKQP